MAASPDLSAVILESRLRAVQMQRDLGAIQLIDCGAEVARLNQVIAAQQTQIQSLQDQLRQAQASTAATVMQLITSIADAVAIASDQLQGNIITNLSAEVRAGLVIQNQGAGFVLSTIAGLQPAAMTTIRFDLRRLPPPPPTADAQAVAALYGAMLDLQAALERGPSGGAPGPVWGDATVRVSLYLSARPGSLADVRPNVLALQVSLKNLAGAVPQLAPAANRLEVALSRAPILQPADGAEIAGALADAALALSGR